MFVGVVRARAEGVLLGQWLEGKDGKLEWLVWEVGVIVPGTL